MMAKNEEIILHLAFLLFQLYIGLNEIKPVVMVLDHQRQLITSLLTTQSDQGLCYFAYLIAYLNLLRLKF